MTEHTLAMSLDTAYAAYEHLDFGAQSGCLQNVLMLGLDSVAAAVLRGEGHFGSLIRKRETGL